MILTCCGASLRTFAGVAVVVVALLHGAAPAVGGPHGSDRPERGAHQEARAEAQGMCSSVLSSGTIVYYRCGKEPAHVCSRVSAEGEILYFICGDMRQDRKAD